jgi:hypothetical protein
MRKSILMWVAVILVFSSVPAWAGDEYPPFEIFGGFSILSMGGGYIDNELEGGREQAFGFHADAVYNFTPSIGVAGDFGGQYWSRDSAIHFYEFMGGPRFSHRTGKFTLFGNALIGVGNRGTGIQSRNAFALGFGGGVDVSLNKRFAVRVIKFDWIPEHFSEKVYGASGNWLTDNIRFGFGIVIR